MNASCDVVSHHSGRHSERDVVQSRARFPPISVVLPGIFHAHGQIMGRILNEQFTMTKCRRGEEGERERRTSFVDRWVDETRSISSDMNFFSFATSIQSIRSIIWHQNSIQFAFLLRSYRRGQDAQHNRSETKTKTEREKTNPWSKHRDICFHFLLSFF